MKHADRQYVGHYVSPMGGITFASDGNALIGLWFDKQKYFGDTLKTQEIADANNAGKPILEQTRHWLDVYFSGNEPDFTPSLKMPDSDFATKVCQIMLEIPYGKVTTYGDIAKQIAAQRGIARMSAQAVGGAVGHNSISIIIPCHRVIGAKGNLTGYGGGIDRKIELLKLEGVDMTGMFRPKHSTAP